MDKRHSRLKTLVMLSSGYQNTLTDDVYDYNQALMNDQFEGLGNIYDIGEEKGRGELLFTPIRASVGVVKDIKSNTVVDNVRSLLFKDLKHDVWEGKRYEFADNIWLTVNVKSNSSMTNSSLVKRCNNTLKWYDYETDIILEEPCIVDEKIDAIVDDDQTYIQNIAGKIGVTLQYNENSKKIKVNHRFIINGSAFTVSMVNATKRISTYDKDSVGNIYLVMGVANVNPDTDDLENNIAYKEKPQDENTILNGNIITPNVYELSPFADYDTQTYEVYNYVDNIPQSDTFEIEFFDALTSKYKVLNVSGNSFTIQCLDFSNVPLVVSCRNTTTNATVEITIKLRGAL